MKLVSWNVNGIRAVHTKGLFLKFIEETKPDILCLQETKAEQGQAVIDLPQYVEYWNSSKGKKGYSGTAIFAKEEPLEVLYDFPTEIVKKYNLKDTYGDPNQEGRVIAAEFDNLLYAQLQARPFAACFAPQALGPSVFGVLQGVRKA